jgi:acyl-CoA synthetase (AMP-forming)/AMP-acid ligase II
MAKGDTVSVMLSNTPAMLEAHHGVPMTGAVLLSINTRLDATSSPSSSITARQGPDRRPRILRRHGRGAALARSSRW